MPAIIQGPTDFKDDPFKDYRYEDPFNIKDPFTDDDTEGSKKNFAEDFSSEGEKSKILNIFYLLIPLPL